MHLVKRVLAILPTLLILGLVVAAEPPVGAEAGIVLLRNGRVLRGRVLLQGDHYLVLLGPGSQVRLPVEAVRLRCRSLEEAYRLQRLAIEPGRADEHLELARWALDMGLLDEAARELEAARQLDHDEPLLAHLQRRLEQVRRQAERPPPSPRPAPVAGPTAEELDQMVRQLPSDVVEQFTSQIQPILLNRCATGGCHGPAGPKKLRLLRPIPGGILPRRLTQRNLHQVLQMIRGDVPAESPLVRQAAAAHGGMVRPPFGRHDQDEYQRLVQWVERLADADEDRTPQHVDKPQTNLLQRAAISRPPRLPGTTIAETAALPAADRSAESPFSTPPEPALQQPYVPVDPFDPELFNRRYLTPR